MKWSITLLLLFIFSPLLIHAQFLDDTPDGPEEMAPAPPGVEPVIPLNKEDPTYNLWKKRRDDLEKGRDPGPINIQRYPGGLAQQGIPTFFRLPVALTPKDLEAGQVEVAMLGAYIDMGFGSRGAVFGPQAFRAPPADYGLWGAFSMPHMPTLIKPGTGTPEPDGLTTREAFPLVRRLCAETNVIGFDLAELLPYRDPGYTTVLNSNRLVRECLVGLAMRKKGITEEHFLNPLTVDDGY